MTPDPKKTDEELRAAIARLKTGPAKIMVPGMPYQPPANSGHVRLDMGHGESLSAQIRVDKETGECEIRKIE